MANTFKAQILTPNGPLFEGDVVSVKAPGSEGNFLMLFNHAPIVSTLAVGEVVISKPDNSHISYAVSGGFVEMNDNVMTLLAEKAEEASIIDVEAARELEADAKARLQDKNSNREEAEKDLAIAKNKLKIAG